MKESEDEIIDEQSFQEYQPTRHEINEYAKFLGFQLPNDNHLLYIAEKGLKAPLPRNWKACKRKNGEVYFHNAKTNESKWEHPSDQLYKQIGQLTTKLTWLKKKCAHLPFAKGPDGDD